MGVQRRSPWRKGVMVSVLEPAPGPVGALFPNGSIGDPDRRAHECLPAPMRASPAPDPAPDAGRPSGRRPRSAEISVRRLVSRITAAGGELRIEDPEPEERAAWRRAFHAATTKGGLPKGMRLRYTGRDSGDVVLRLVADIPANQPRSQPPAVAVPDRVGRLHPLVAELREHPERLGVSAAVRPRALASCTRRSRPRRRAAGALKSAATTTRRLST